MFRPDLSSYDQTRSNGKGKNEQNHIYRELYEVMMRTLLLPLGWLFFAVVALRRALYRFGFFVSVRLPVPVVIVGNITVGGNGKTPLVIWLVEEMMRRGRHPGVISRGYGGAVQGVLEVHDESVAMEVGDEPLLIRRRGRCPVFVGRDRVATGQALLAAYPLCDLIISDDGLQHYRLKREVEIAVEDGRGLENGLPLPAGLLREPLSRLDSVDFLIANGWDGPDDADFNMRIDGDHFYRLDSPDQTCIAMAFAYQRLHAVAGIGNPSRFFLHLIARGLVFEPHAFPDHHPYTAADLAFEGDAILTTEKDAVKFGSLAHLPVWVLPVTATVNPKLAQLILEKIDGCPTA
ncbi:MAG: tetraacyldisaccharide 4'-kinase [Rhodocyclaceae bacterium]|nr:tetraacyldisaccharide 4'-kinase [Rhodocyclaceae bacterium]